MYGDDDEEYESRYPPDSNYGRKKGACDVGKEEDRTLIVRPFGTGCQRGLTSSPRGVQAGVRGACDEEQ